MKKILFLSLIVLFFSCSNSPNIIYYKYNNQVVTRFNNYPKDYFLLGKYSSIDDTLNSSFIKTSFRGFDGGMSGYLIFNPDNTVKIISQGGNFEKFGENDSIVLVEFESNIKFINWHKKIKKNFSNAVKLSDVIKLEASSNKKYKSLVNVDYGKINFEN